MYVCVCVCVCVYHIIHYDGKESACQCKKPRFNPRVRKIPWRRKQKPTLVFSPRKYHGQRSLVGHSP